MAYILVASQSVEDLFEAGCIMKFKPSEKEEMLKAIKWYISEKHFCVMAYEEKDSEEGE